MAIFAGKTPAERNKIIVAIALGALALFALYMAFGPSLRSSQASPKSTPTPTPSSSPATTGKLQMPTQSEQVFGWTTVPVEYNGPIAGPTDVGRNIFAFYEPPPPGEKTPTPLPAVNPPTPPPPPPVPIAYVMPQSKIAGTGDFPLEVNGDKFTPDMRIYFNQSQMPTNFVSAQKLTTQIPGALIASEGPKGILVQSLDGKLYSNQIILNVQPAPKPQFQYIGMIGRKRFNNDTGYFQESGKQLPTAARLNDIVGGRFRLVNLTSATAVFEDVDLKFRYPLPLQRESAGGSGGMVPPSRSDPSDGRFNNGGGFMNPQVQIYPPGTNPNEYMPPGQGQPRPQRPQRPTPNPDKKDVDDDDTDN